ncbi:MAG: glycosyltransferase family 2 protein [Rikenellaceae bacterium]
MIKVSIIIPVYNTEKYLRECLDSIVGQTLQEIEVVCVNDGSTDGSLEILKEYAAKDSRIIIVDKENEGAGESRNKGLAVAKGDAVIFFDSDDYMEPSALEVMYKALMRDVSDLVVCRSMEIDEDGAALGPINYSVKSNLIDGKSKFSPLDYASHIFQIFVGWPWDKLYRRSFIIDSGLQFQNLRNSEDTFFILISLVLAEQITCVDDCFMLHRKHQRSISVTRQKHSTCFIDALEHMYLMLKEKKIFDAYMRSYQNYCISFAKWHYATIGNDKSREVIVKSSAKLFKKYGLIKLGQGAFYDKGDYQWMMHIYAKRGRLFSVVNIDIDGCVYKQINILGLRIHIRNKRRERKRAAEQEKQLMIYGSQAKSVSRNTSI